MSQMVHFKLSPNEEARLLKEERERRRKLRIQQVREQSKVNAAKVRQSVQCEKERLLRELAEQLQNQWLREKQEQLNELESVLERTVHCVGEGHRQAAAEQIELQRECRELLQQEDLRKAQLRHQVALIRQSDAVRQRQLEENQHVLNRQAALEIERARSSKIASLPPPPRDPVDTIEPVKLRPVKFTDRDAFTTTHYHISNAVVEKATNEEMEFDAKQVAEVEGEKLHDLELEKRRTEHERTEKARLRHKHAMEKETLKDEYNKLMLELSGLQRADVNRRRQCLEHLPKQIYIAPHRRLEEKEVQQLNMERAFEDLYMNVTEFTGDLNLALDPHPPPVTPSLSDSLDITSQLDETAGGTTSFQQPEESSVHSPPGHHPAHSPPRQTATSELPIQPPKTIFIPSATCDAGDGPRPPFRLNASQSLPTRDDGPLKKLYERIKNQRENWMQKSLQEPSGTTDDAATDDNRTRSRVAETSVPTTFGVDSRPFVVTGTSAADLSEGTITDSTPSLHGSEQRNHLYHRYADGFSALRHPYGVGNVPSLSEGSFVDSTTPGSLERRSPLPLEEGTILSSANSYRYSQHFPSVPVNISEETRNTVQQNTTTSFPVKLATMSQVERPRINTVRTEETRGTSLYNDVLKQRQRIDEERQSLEERLRAIEDKQRQLEAQDRVISEALDFGQPPPGRSYRTYGDMAPFEDPCRDIPGTTKSAEKRVAVSLRKTTEDQFGSSRSVPEGSGAVGRGSSGPTFSSSVPTGLDRPVESVSRVRDYQHELLRRQEDRQRALLEARRHLQLKAQQLLDEGRGGFSESHSVAPSRSEPTLDTDTRKSSAGHDKVAEMPLRSDAFSGTAVVDNRDRVVPVDLSNISEGYEQPEEQSLPMHTSSTLPPKSYHAENYAELNYPPFSQTTGATLADGHELNASVTSKPYNPQFYTPASGLDGLNSENVDDRYEEGLSNAERRPYDPDPHTNEDLTDDDYDERDFITPELRADGRQRPCRPTDFTPSSLPRSETSSVPRIPLDDDIAVDHSAMHAVVVKASDKDDFDSRVLQARQDLETRQRQIQDQLDMLENEERQLAEQQQRITTQLSSFSERSEIATQMKEQRRFLLDPYVSSSSDLLALVGDGIFPSFSTSRTPGPYNASSLQISSYEGLGLDLSARRSDELNHSAKNLSSEHGTLSSLADLESYAGHDMPSVGSGVSSGDVESIGGTGEDGSHQQQLPVGNLSGGAGDSLCRPDGDSIEQQQRQQHSLHDILRSSSFLGAAPDSLQSECGDVGLTANKAVIGSTSETKQRLLDAILADRDSPLPVSTSTNSPSLGSPCQQSRTPTLSSSGTDRVGSFPLAAWDKKSDMLPTSSLPSGHISGLPTAFPSMSDIVDRNQKSGTPIFSSTPSDRVAGFPAAVSGSFGVDQTQKLPSPRPTGVSRASPLTENIPSSSAGLTSLDSGYFQSSSNLRLNWETLFQPYKDERNAWRDSVHPSVRSGSDYSAAVRPDFSRSPRSNNQMSASHQQPPCEATSSLLRTLPKSELERLKPVDNSETGITDEPDLTLVSGATSANVTASMSPDKSTLTTPGRSTDDSSSLVSFEQHERSVVDQNFSPWFPTESSKPPDRVQVRAAGHVMLLPDAASNLRPVSPSASDRKSSCSRTSRDSKNSSVRFALPEDELRSGGREPAAVRDASSCAVSLQDALASRKPDFLRRSEQRLAEAKEKAKSTVVAEKQYDALTQTIASWKKNRGITARPDAETGRNAEPGPTLVVECTEEDRKKAEKKMKERTLRLYNQLDEVKQRKAEEERRSVYAQNRERRKEYEKKVGKQKKTASGK